MKTKKTLMISIVILILIMVSSGSLLAKTTLTYWTWLSNEDLVAEFNAQNQDIEVNHIKMGYYDMLNKFRVAISSGTGAPDVMQMTQRHFSGFSTTGKLMDISNEVNSIKGNFPEGLINIASYQNKLYGLPADVSPAVVWYRKDIIDKYGIDVPIETWDDFVEVGNKLKEEGIYIMPLFYPAGGWGANALTMYLHSRKGNIYTQDGEIIKNNLELEYTLEWLKELQEQNIAEGIKFFTPSFWAALEGGKYATWPMNVAEGANIKNYMPDLAGKWGVMPFPKWEDKDEKTTGVWGGTVLTTPNQSDKNEAALKFIKWVAGTVDGQVWASKTWNAVPSYNPAYDNTFYSKGDSYFDNDNVYKKINTIPSFNYYDWQVTERIIGKQLDLLFADKVTPQEARAAIESNLAEETGRGLVELIK